MTFSSISGEPDAAGPDGSPSEAGHRRLSAVATLTAGEILARFAGFFATTVLAHRLGPDGFGTVAFGTAVAGYLALAVNSSLHEIGAREIARARERAVAIYWSVAAVRLVLATVALAVLAIVAWNLPKPSGTRLVVLLSGLSFFSLALDPTWALKGLERPALAAGTLVLGQCVYALGVVVMVGGPADVVRAPILQFTGEIFAAGIVWALTMRHAPGEFAFAEGIRVLRGSGYLAAARAFRLVAITADVVLLGLLTTDREVGLYNAAYRVTFLLMAIAAAVTAAYLPAFSRTKDEPEAARQLATLSLETSAVVGAPLVAGTTVLAFPIMTLLFGPEYGNGARALQLLAPSVGVVFLYSVVSNVLVTWHRTRVWAGIRAVAAIASVVVNLVVIPRWGFVGAAAVTLGGELLVGVAGALVLLRMHLLPSLRPLIAPFGAAAFMSTVLRLVLNEYALISQVAAGALLYVLGLIVLGFRPLRAIAAFRRRRVSLQAPEQEE